MHRPEALTPDEPLIMIRNGHLGEDAIGRLRQRLICAARTIMGQNA
jgi:hypothetical protein